MRIRRNTNISNVSVFHLALVTMAALVRHVITEDCRQEELVQCTRPLQVLSATSELSFVTKKEELDKLCPDLHKGLHCIRSYTRRCMNIHQRDHFNKLYHGTNEVIHELCEEGSYQEGTLRGMCSPVPEHHDKDRPDGGNDNHNDCSFVHLSNNAPHPAAVLSNGGGHYHGSDMSQHHHHRQHELSGGAHPNSTKSIEDAEEERLKTVCCAFQKYMQCSEFTVRHACGDETALFTRKFLDKMSNTLMRWIWKTAKQYIENRTVTVDLLRRTPRMRLMKEGYSLNAFQYKGLMTKINQTMATTTTTTSSIQKCPFNWQKSHVVYGAFQKFIL